MASKPKIACLPNGPYYLLNDMEAAPVPNLRRASGEACHGYAGKRITILDNRAICSHAAFCTDELKAAFRHHESPWIDPDGAELNQIIEVIRKCPSGALSSAIEGVGRAVFTSNLQIGGKQRSRFISRAEVFLASAPAWAAWASSFRGWGAARGSPWRSPGRLHYPLG